MAYTFGDLGEDELILGIWGAKAKYFQGAEDFSGIGGDQCIIFGEKGSTDPLGVSLLVRQLITIEIMSQYTA